VRVAKQKDQAEASPSFEASLAELEALVKQLESADVPLEKAIQLFERATKLSEACRKLLTEAETKIEILLKKEGGVEAAPFADGSSSPDAP
jgi:exodeoxyribonuclease VII small subunit